MYQVINELIKQWLAEPLPEPRRVFHGRGHLYEGLEHINIDWYPPLMLVTAYDTLENQSDLFDGLKAADPLNQIETIIFQKRSGRGAEAECVWGEPCDMVVVEENGLKFEVQPGVNQNSGFFLDMRPLRAWLKQYSAEKNVLNMFAYTCSLSVAALAGDARQVVSVDMSKPSIKWGTRNHELNGHDLRSTRTIPHNLFRSWGRIKQFGPYDVIIIDPPTRQKGSFNAEKDYVTLLKKLSLLMKPGADIIATVNSPYLGHDYLPNLMQRYQPKLRLLGDFPVSPEFEDKFPERGLKIYHFRAPSAKG